jgi:hypothetical protein
VAVTQQTAVPTRLPSTMSAAAVAAAHAQPLSMTVVVVAAAVVVGVSQIQHAVRCEVEHRVEPAHARKEGPLFQSTRPRVRLWLCGASDAERPLS